MKDTEYIVGVYNYINANPELNSDSAYFLLYLLDQRGILDRQEAVKLYDEHFKSKLMSDELMVSSSKMIGPFESTDLLNQFAFQFCEVLNAEKVTLISVQEYNTLLEGSQTASDFHRDLLLQGNVMENIERKKKGFLSRFF
jgi:hypothetical protein